MVDSWDGKRAHDYRSAARISDELEATVNVMGMVFCNFGADAATGVAMPRNATEGEAKLEGDFLVNARGEDVVAGMRETRRSKNSPSSCPRSPLIWPGASR